MMLYVTMTISRAIPSKRKTLLLFVPFRSVDKIFAKQQ